MTTIRKGDRAGRPYNRNRMIWKMTFDPKKHHRRSIRLKGYDYSQAGAYFVTACVYRRECLLGDVTHGEMVLNEYGRVVCEYWEWIPKQYPYVDLDEWIVMPNHMHGIIVMVDDNCRGGSRTAPTIRRKPLGRLVGAFKTVSTKRINQMRGTPGAMVWQRNYHEHIIRDEKSLNNIRRYIRANPLMWMYDVENPNRMECLTEQTGRALARHYGFTDEELDFIINYDIKYRMGREDQEGEEE